MGRLALDEGEGRPRVSLMCSHQEFNPSFQSALARGETEDAE